MKQLNESGSSRTMFGRGSHCITCFGENWDAAEKHEREHHQKERIEDGKDMNNRCR